MLVYVIFYINHLLGMFYINHLVFYNIWRSTIFKHKLLVAFYVRTGAQFSFHDGYQRGLAESVVCLCGVLDLLPLFVAQCNEGTIR